MLEQALIYADRGFSVIPIASDSKKPLIKWQKFQHERASKDRISRFWTKHPTTNIGLVCGQISNLIVIDVDPRNGGDKSIHGKEIGITPTVRTPSKGNHFYCTFDSIIRKCKPLMGVDIQSEGSYILAPPSKLPIGEYDFEKDRDLTTALIRPPRWLYDLLAVSKESKQNWRQYIGGVNEGNRNEAATKIAGAVVQRTNDPRITLHALRGWNLQNHPSLPEGDLETIVNSVWNIHQRNHEHIVVKDMGELLKHPVPKIEWLIKDIWPKGNVGFVAGEPEQGKTWMMLDMAMSISQGVPFLGAFDVGEKGPILLIEEEQSEVEILQRLKLLLHGKKDLTLDDFHVIIQEGIMLPKDTNHIIQILQKHHCKALFIDSLRRIHNKEENSSTEMKIVLNALSRIRKETGVSIVIIHHLSKPQPNKSSHPLARMRGSIDLLAWADTAIGLIPTESGSHNLVFKMRGAPKPMGLVLHRTFDPIEKTMKLSEGGI